MAGLSDFQSLLVGACEGDDPAWTDLYSLFAPALLGFLRGQGMPDPENTLGEVWHDIARNIARFDGGPEQFRAWAFTIARNRVIDERRRSSRRPISHDHIPDRAAPGDIEADALAHESAARILTLLLSENQRDVILLRFVADLSVAQTAQVLGKREGAVKAIQNRAIAQLRKKLKRPVSQN